MAGLTKDGFIIKRYEEILNELNTDLVDNLGIHIDTSVNSVAGIQNSIVAKQLASLWELGENVYDGGDLLKAEGEQLDNLALIQGIIRQSAQQTRGIAWFRGDDGVQITTSNFIGSLAGDVFVPEKNFSIVSTNSLECTAKISLVVGSSVYQIRVNGAIFTYTSGNDTTATTIRDALLNSLQLGVGQYTSTAVGEDSIKIVSDDNSQALNVSASSYVTFSEVLTPANIIAQQYGHISGDALAVKNIETPVNGWDSVENPTDLNLGRNQETDEELRTRILQTYSTIGSGTPDTIVQRVLDITNVQSAVMYENVRWATDTSLVPNLPPKSYTVTVYDGLSDDIAKVIWETKPAGIQTVGNTTVVITDRFGQEHEVHFSRPSTEYAWIKIYYTKYSEEVFPVDGEDRMKEACLIFGDSLDINEDIIPRRFTGECYSNVAGLDFVEIQMAITEDPNISDPDDSRLTYTANRIPITAAQVSTFGKGRMRTYLNTTPP